MTNGITDPNVLQRFISQAAAQGGSLSSSSSRGSSGGDGGSWFRALAQAWGDRLNAQAAKIETLSSEIGAGADNPGQMVALTSESLRMGFLSQNASTSLNATADGLTTTARKQ